MEFKMEEKLFESYMKRASLYLNEDEDFEFWNSFNNWFLKQKGDL